MTAFAISLSRAKIVVAADSLAYIPNRQEVTPLGFVSKVLPLPHQRAVMFSRGQLEPLVRAHMAVCMMPLLETIEDVSAILPDVLRNLVDDYARAQGIEDTSGVLELVLAGWSPTEKRMRIFQFCSWADFKPEDDGGKMWGTHSFPRLPLKFMPRTSGAATDADLVRVVQAAGKWFEADPVTNCGMKIDGEIIATELTADAMSTRVIHRFADFEVTKHAAAAIRSRIDRGDLDVSHAVADGIVPGSELTDSETGLPLVQGAQLEPAAPTAQAVQQPLSRQQRRLAERMARKGKKAA